MLVSTPSDTSEGLINDAAATIGKLILKNLWWPHEEETVSVCHGCVFDIISQRLCYMTFFTITKLFREKEITVNILFFSFLKLHVRVNILKVKKVKVHTSRGSSLPQKTLLVNSLGHKSETLWHHTTFPYHRFVCTCKKKKQQHPSRCLRTSRLVWLFWIMGKYGLFTWCYHRCIIDTIPISLNYLSAVS